MNEEDLRDCFAMFITAGMVLDNQDLDPSAIWSMADAIVEARTAKTKSGIAAVVEQWDQPFVEEKPKRTYTRRSK